MIRGICHARYLLVVLVLAAALACTTPASQPDVPADPVSTTAAPGPTPELEMDTTPSAEGLLASLTDPPPERDVARLARELIPGIGQEFDWVVAKDPEALKEGRVDTFWLADLDGLEVYESRFELALVSARAYWYVESGGEADRDALERSAEAFEERIYPTVTSVFGSEWSPGVDGDTRVTIVNGSLRGAGGYFNSSDEYPRAVFPYSNQREMIYINTAFIPIGSSAYFATLAHEFQHLVHWNQDSSEDTWVNEGLAELAVSVTGYGARNVRFRLDSVPTSLVNWPLDSERIGASYATASLFMHYLSEHYGSRDDMRALVSTPADGVEGIDQYLRNSGYTQTFHDVFRDWAAANFLDAPDGIYGYSDLNVGARPRKSIDGFSSLESEIPQYAVEYVRLESFNRPIRVRFRGPSSAPIIPDDVGPRGCWWSNVGDSIDSTLTAGLDFRDVERPVLRYEAWYDIEEDWDYAYAQVSMDGGERWQILTAPGMSAENPMGTAFGSGYTGSSGGWTTETLDLSSYAGQEVKVRFQYLTDDAIHGPGLCLRGAGVVDGGDVRPVTEWEPRGFVLIGNRTPQTYIVQIIEGGTEKDDAPRVTVMELDPSNSGSVEIPAPQDSERLVVAVAALARGTFQPASYTLTIEPGG